MAVQQISTTEKGASGGVRVYELLIAIGVALALGAFAGVQWARREKPSVRQIQNAFHAWFWSEAWQTWDNSRWLGIPAEKTPWDAWVYQEILWETKPDVLIETGTYKGGSAYFFATMMDLIGHGRVISVDIKDWGNRPAHPRITYVMGSSIAPETIARLRMLVHSGERAMVSLDSVHERGYNLRELRLYSQFVTPGDYLVLEDTNLNGHPVGPTGRPGPAEALQEFLKANRNFQPDLSREKFGVTFFPGGWLKRVQ